MPDSEPPAILKYQVLADLTGRRRRRLAVAGRVATTALGLWLVVLILGGLGLEPLGGLPIVGNLGVVEPAPPALPQRVRAAVAKGTTVAPVAPAAQAPTTAVGRPGVPAPSGAKARPPAPTTTPTRTKPTTGRGPDSAAPAPSRPTTNPSTTAPGQTRTAPGQTKTGPGSPSTTPGTTPGGKSKGKALGATGK